MFPFLETRRWLGTQSWSGSASIRHHSFVHKCCTPLLKSFEVFQNMKHKPSWNQLKWSKTWSKMMRGNPWLNHCDVPKHVVTWCRKMKFNVATDMPATHTHTPNAVNLGHLATRNFNPKKLKSIFGFLDRFATWAKVLSKCTFHLCRQVNGGCCPD